MSEKNENDQIGKMGLEIYSDFNKNKIKKENTINEKLDFNWIEEMNLDIYADPEENKTKIEKKVDEKYKNYIRSSPNSIDKLCKKCVDYGKKKILEDIFDVEKYGKMMKDVEEKIFNEIDSILGYFDNKLLTEEEIEKILSMIKYNKIEINKDIIKERILIKGKKVAISNYEDYKNKRDRKVKKILFKNIDKNLEALNKKNLYDFLSAKDLSLNFLTKKNIESERKNLKKNNQVTTLEKELYNFCKILRDGKITEYNEYLEKKECDKIKEELKNIREIVVEEFKERNENKKNKSMKNIIRNFSNNFKELVDKETAKKIFFEYFRSELENIDSINIDEVENEKNLNKSKKKRSFLFLKFFGVMIFLVIISWSHFNKKDYERNKTAENQETVQKKIENQKISVNVLSKDNETEKNLENKIKEKEAKGFLIIDTPINLLDKNLKRGNLNKISYCTEADKSKSKFGTQKGVNLSLSGTEASIHFKNCVIYGQQIKDNERYEGKNTGEITIITGVIDKNAFDKVMDLKKWYLVGGTINGLKDDIGGSAIFNGSLDRKL